jgi:ribosomal protein S27AE
MKFCPECGSKLPIGTAKFCSNCGASLWATASETRIGGGSAEGVEEQRQSTAATNTKEHTPLEEEEEQQSSTSSLGEPRKEEQDEIKGEFQNQTIHSLGVKFGETVEQILKSNGYSTETRFRVKHNKSNS